MLPRLRRKLNSRSGASLVIALIFFLLCVTIGGLIVTAAGVSSGKTVGSRRSQQGYLAVASAARLVRRDLEGAKFSGNYQVKVTTTTTVTTGTDANGDPVSSSSVTTDTAYSYNAAQLAFTGPDADRPRLLKASGMELAYFYFSKLPANILGNLSVPPGDLNTKTCDLTFAEVAELSIPQVTGKISIDKDYKMVVELKDDKGTNRLYLIYTPTVSQPSVSSQTAVSSTGDTALEVVTSTYTTAVTWGEPVFSGKEPS